MERMAYQEKHPGTSYALRFTLFGLLPLLIACSPLRSVRVKGVPPLNVNDSGVSTPVKVRIYQLKDDANFRNARFEELYDDHKKALGGDILDFKEVDIEPGDDRDIELGKIASATQTFRLAADNGVDSPQMHYTRGIVLENQGLSEEALDAYARALELEPGNIDYLVALAECLATNGRTAEAAEILGSDAQLLNDDGSIAMLRAHIAALEGDDSEAVRLLRHVRRSNPGSHLAREELGRLLARTGQCAEGD